MYDLISMGTVAVDLYFKGDSLTFEDDRFQLAIGGKYFADTFYEGLGGGATNVAIGAKKQGLHVGLAATIGDNVFRKVISHKLSELQLKHDLCIYQEDYYNISAVLVAPTGDRSIINYRSRRQAFYDDEGSMDELLKTRSIYLANLPNFSLERKANMLKFFKDHKITTYSNLGVADCRKSFADIRHFLRSVDVLIINAHEFSEMVRTPYERIDYSDYVKDTYLGEFENLVLILTDGKNGSYGYYDGKVHHQKAIEPKEVVDATGAGDAFTAGFIATYNQTRDAAAAMAAGAEYAAKIIGVVGSN
ncbi:MAG: carbohydrate kinase family protein [Patescibacteria group bacterium]|nr:carbohydrate kinase family protein [Patescibacteria group bacterium]